MAPTVFSVAARAAVRAAQRAFRYIFTRPSPRILPCEAAFQPPIQAGNNPSIPLPASNLYLQILPIEMILEIADHVFDEKTYYVFSKPPNANWKLVIDPDRPGHKPPGGRAVFNPRRYGSQFLHNYRPTANLAAACPEFAPYLKVPPPAITPQPLDVFFLVKGVERRAARQYQIQEQHMLGWGVVTEVNQGPNVEWPRGIPFAL